MSETVGRIAVKAGAICYLAWGLLHIYAATLSFQLGAGLEFGAVQSKVYQNGWNLAFISVLCCAVAVFYNWRNSISGYWLNLITISVVDIGFLILIYVPGHSPDLLGPTLWIAGAILTTAGMVAAPRTG